MKFKPRKAGRFFPYSGNKLRHIPDYLELGLLPDLSGKTLYSPFIGSGALELHWPGAPHVAYHDANSRLMQFYAAAASDPEHLLGALRKANEILLEAQGGRLKKALKFEKFGTVGELAKRACDAYFGPHHWARDRVEDALEVVLQLSLGGVVQGTWSCKQVYLKNSIDVERFEKALAKMQYFEEVSWRRWFRQPRPISGLPFYKNARSCDFLYLDPPYGGTSGVYGNKKAGFANVPKAVSRMVAEAKKLGIPGLLSYGDTYAEDFPELEFQLVKTKTVPKVRGGGSIKRGEYVHRWGY